MSSKTFLIALATASLVASFPGSTWAALAMNLSSTPDDLTSVAVGDTVTISVEIAGLVPGDSADFLAATVEFDTSILGTPAFVSAPLVPDPNNFLPTQAPGLFDGFFDSALVTPGAAILTNGPFYTFDVTPVGVGTTDIRLTFVDALGNNVNGASINGPALSLTAVPEPSAFALLGLVGVLSRVYCWRKQRRQRVTT